MSPSTGLCEPWSPSWVDWTWKEVQILPKQRNTWSSVTYGLQKEVIFARGKWCFRVCRLIFPLTMFRPQDLYMVNEPVTKQCCWHYKFCWNYFIFIFLFSLFSHCFQERSAVLKWDNSNEIIAIPGFVKGTFPPYRRLKGRETPEVRKKKV